MKSKKGVKLLSLTLAAMITVWGITPALAEELQTGDTTTTTVSQDASLSTETSGVGGGADATADTNVDTTETVKNGGETGTTDSTAADTGKTDSTTTDTGKTDGTTTDSGKTDGTTTDTGKTDGTTTDTGKTDGTTTDTGKTDGTTTDTGKTDGTTTDTGKTDGTTTDTGKTDGTTTDTGKTDGTTTDTGKTDGTTTDTTTTDAAAGTTTTDTPATSTDSSAAYVPATLGAQSMNTNLHAGNAFYVGQLQSDYHITFSSDFSSVMEEIEKNYMKDSGTRAMNWSDVLAVYILKQERKGQTEYVLDSSCKDELARVFAGMNTMSRDKDGNVTYASTTIDAYIEANQSKLTEDEIALLKSLTSQDCKILCAASTAAKGFVYSSLGSDVTEERAEVIAAAYSLVGKISYFWGGKSTTIGWDSRWGAQEQVTATGSNDTGSTGSFGLDCSGFVTWSYVNGYKNAAMQSVIGQGTASQWAASTAISEEDAEPGDLVFLEVPNADSINHVGVIVGQNDNGDWIVAHCNASDNGVVIQEAYSAGFRYIRRANYPSADAQQAAIESAREEVYYGSVSANQSELDLLAALLYCEAGVDYDNDCAVGAVVMNRVRSSQFPNTISEVIYQAGQFTPVGTGKVARILESGAPAICYEAAQQALSGYSNVGGCLYFRMGTNGTYIIGDNAFR